MSNVVTTQADVPALAMAEAELLSVLQTSLYPGANPDSIKMVIAWCRASNKDPLKRPVHIVPMPVKDPRTGHTFWRDVIMPGIADYRIDAARTGQYAGISDAAFGPTIEGAIGGYKMAYPEWCEISVYRMVGGVRCAFSSGKVRFLEAFASTKDGSPNSMWKKRPFGQLEKCAEAMALRRAFPEVGGTPTSEEMEGREVLVEAADVAPAAPAVKTPTRRAEAAVIAPPAPSDDVIDMEMPTEVSEAPVAPIRPAAGASRSAPAPVSGDDPVVGQGELAFLRRKADDAGVVLEDMAGEHGVDLSAMTRSQFTALKAALRGLGA